MDDKVKAIIEAVENKKKLTKEEMKYIRESSDMSKIQVIKAFYGVSDCEVKVNTDFVINDNIAYCIITRTSDGKHLCYMNNDGYYINLVVGPSRSISSALYQTIKMYNDNYYRLVLLDRQTIDNNNDLF